MKQLFNQLARNIKLSFDGLAEDRPNIEWVKAVEDISIAAFAAQHSTRLAGKMAGTHILMKAEDGRIFKRNKWDKKPVWHGEVDGEQKTFRSPYLDSLLEKAIARGMKSQPSAFDIRRRTTGPHSQRLFIIFNGTDEEFENLDKTHPTAPAGFSDHHTPEDFDDSHPYFAAYLRKIGHEPFRFTVTRAPKQTLHP